MILCKLLAEGFLADAERWPDLGIWGGVGCVSTVAASATIDTATGGMRL